MSKSTTSSAPLKEFATVEGLERQAQDIFWGLAAVNLCIKLVAWAWAAFRAVGDLCVCPERLSRVVGEEVPCTGTRVRR